MEVGPLLNRPRASGWFPRRINFWHSRANRFPFLLPIMKRYLPFIIVLTVALITFGSGFALYHAKKQAGPVAAKDGPTGVHIRGPNSALVTIEEFGDFQCPPCSVMALVLKKTEEEHGSRLRVIFHHFPLPNHPHARPAALAAEAADLQGKFWDMHDLLYREQTSWSKADNIPVLFESYAKSIGLDMERFEKDLKSPALLERIESDHKLGASRGVTSTPTLFVNNVLLPADQLNPEALKKAIDAALKEKPKS
jgi:protein-disulfide isomerase